jgi:hypothetical protein
MAGLMPMRFRGSAKARGEKGFNWRGAYCAHRKYAR